MKTLIRLYWYYIWWKQTLPPSVFKTLKARAHWEMRIKMKTRNLLTFGYSLIRYTKTFKKLTFNIKWNRNNPIYWKRLLSCELVRLLFWQKKSRLVNVLEWLDLTGTLKYWAIVNYRLGTEIKYAYLNGISDIHVPIVPVFISRKLKAVVSKLTILLLTQS